jgi:ArsR family transcriptional regulator
MEQYSAVKVLAALAQASRLAVFRLLVEAGPEGLPAGRIAERLEMPNATLSFHLKELVAAGLAKARQQGRLMIYTADLERVGALVGFLTDHCCGGRPELCRPAAQAGALTTRSDG